MLTFGELTSLGSVRIGTASFYSESNLASGIAPVSFLNLVARGTLEGTIATAPRGNEGFGYDPIFVPLGESRTVAELGSAWKARHSARAKAASSLASLLGSSNTL